MKEESDRIAWIDVARGIAILLVILGHSIGNLDNVGNKLILSFHMPLFFFLSGLCAHITNISFFDFLRKKFKTLIIPQITLGSIGCMYDLVRGGGWQLIDNFTVWFLPVLFYVNIAFYFIQKLDLNNKIVVTVTFALIFIAIFISDSISVCTKLHIEILPMALLFYLLGFYLKPMTDTIIKLTSSVWLFAIPICVICSYYNAPVAMYMNNYGNYVLFFFGSISGILFVCNLSVCLSQNRLLKFIGINSMIIYVLHFKLISALHFIVSSAISGLQENNYIYPHYWLYFSLTVLILIPTTYVCIKYLGVFFGKGRKLDRQLNSTKD